MLTKPLGPVNLIVANTQLVARDPDDRPLGAQGGVLKGALHELVALGGRQVFDLVGEAGEEGIVGRLTFGVGMGEGGVGVAIGGGGGEVEFAAQETGAAVAGAVGPGFAGEEVVDVACAGGQV